MNGSLKFNPGLVDVLIGSPNLVTIAVFVSSTTNIDCIITKNIISPIISIAVYDLFILIL